MGPSTLDERLVPTTGALAPVAVPWTLGAFLTNASGGRKCRAAERRSPPSVRPGSIACKIKRSTSFALPYLHSPSRCGRRSGQPAHGITILYAAVALPLGGAC